MSGVHFTRVGALSDPQVDKKVSLDNGPAISSPSSTRCPSTPTGDFPGCNRPQVPRFAAPARILRSCLRSPGRDPANKNSKVKPGRHHDVEPTVETFIYEVFEPMNSWPTAASRAGSPSAQPNVIVGLQQVGINIARAKYLEYHLYGCSPSPWPIVWSNTACFVFVPPCGRKPPFKDNKVDKWGIECWRVT